MLRHDHIPRKPGTKKTGHRGKTGDKGKPGTKTGDRRDVPQLFGPSWERRALAGLSLRHFRSCLFPQPSTTKIPLLVTNNLDREFQKAQAHYMREGSLNPNSTTDFLNGSHSAGNSLFWNILQISPCRSRFYAEPHSVPNRQVFQNQYFTKPNEKVGTDHSAAKSVFWNILRVTPCGSRFCADSTLSPPTKSLRMSILEKGMKKTGGHP